MPGKGGNRRGKHDISPMVRGAFVEALHKIKDRTGKTFSDIIADMIEENPYQTLQTVSKFVVRELSATGKIEHDHTHEHKSVSQTDQWLAEIAEHGESGPPQKPMPH